MGRCGSPDAYVINDEDLPVPVILVQENGDTEVAIEVCLDETDCFQAISVFSGANNSLGMKVVGGSQVGPGVNASNFEEIIVKKIPDRFSPLFFRCVSIGEPLSKVEIKVNKIIEVNVPLPLIKYNLTNVFITTLNQLINIPDKIVEEVSLSFSKFCIEIIPYKEDGSSDASIEYCYDLSKRLPQKK